MSKLSLIIISLVALILLKSCKESVCCDIPPDCCFTPDEIFINLKDKNGNDLLDQSKDLNFKIQDIRAYHYYDNQEWYINGSNENSKINKLSDDNLNYYKINLTKKLLNNTSRALIKWNSTNIDTIDAIYSINNKVLSKIIINSKEIYNEIKEPNKKYLYKIYLIK